MLHATVATISLLVAWQAQPPSRPELKVDEASRATGWLAPTKVRLDFPDRTLADIVEGLNAQGPAMLAIGGSPRNRLPGAEARPEPPPLRYSIVEPGPATFWEAVDRACRAARTWPTSGNAPTGGRRILLIPASDEPGFACSDGAFRVVVTSASYSSRFQFAPYLYDLPGPEPPRADGSSRRPELTVNAFVMAEPRLRIVGPVELVVSEATDDRGRSLIPKTPWQVSLTKPAGRSYPNQEHVGISLLPLDDPGRKIKRLAGRIVLEVSEDRDGAARRACRRAVRLRRHAAAVRIVSARGARQNKARGPSHHSRHANRPPGRADRGSAPAAGAGTFPENRSRYEHANRSKALLAARPPRAPRWRAWATWVSCRGSGRSRPARRSWTPRSSGSSPRSSRPSGCSRTPRASGCSRRSPARIKKGLSYQEVLAALLLAGRAERPADGRTSGSSSTRCSW